MSLIARDYDNVRLTSFVREVPMRTAAILNQYLPDREVQTRTFKVRSFQPSNGAASFRAFDVPSRVAARVGYTERTGSLPPISEAMILGEEESLDIAERVARGAWDEVVDAQIFDDAATLTRRIRNRMEQARAQVLLTGKFTLSGENGQYYEADFGVPGSNFTTVGTSWATVATADPMGDLRTVNEACLDLNGVPVAYAIMTPARVSNLLQNTKIRELLSVGSTVPSLATRGDVQTLLTAHGLPTIVEYDYRVSGSSVWTADKVVCIPAPDADEFGRTEWGVTAEALELNVAYGDRPGLVGTVLKSEDPVQVKTNVSGIGMPVLTDPNKLFVLDVVP